MSEVSVHVKDKHVCGHVHEAIFHMKDAKIDGNIQTHFPEIEPARASFNPHMDIEQEHTLELSGNVEKTEVHMCKCCGFKSKSLWRRFLDWIKREQE